MSALTLGKNLASLRAQRSLADAASRLAATSERLSSGERINRASDDSAGLAVSTSLAVSSRIFTQGVRNLNDGISALSVADGALENLSAITDRLSELAEQAANGSFSSTQRRALDNEAQQLAREFTRITASTTFNGLAVFAGANDTLVLQSGFGSDGVLFLFKGGSRGDGSLTAATTYVMEDTNGFGVALGDLNGDGVRDVVSTGYDSVNAGDFSVRLGNADGTFRSRMSYALGSSDNGAPAMELVDLNNDNVLDVIATAKKGAGRTWVYIGNGDGTFQAQGSFGFLTDSMSTGDLNGDGIADVFTTNTVSNNVFLGNGNGTFRTGVSLAVPFGGTQDSAIGDINNDGKLDLIVVSTGSVSAEIYLGNGDGNFSAGTAFTMGGISNAVTVADLNNDGNLDLVGAGAVAANVRLGNGDGTFTAQTAYSSGATALRSVRIGDMNGDGNLDLIAGTSNSKIEVFMNAGNGTFAAVASFATGGGNAVTKDLAIGDVNGDGALDVVADNYGGGVQVLFGRTTGGLGALTPVSLTSVIGARQAISDLALARTRLGTYRGQIGAAQARATAALSVSGQFAVANQEAAGRITSADVAEEAANLARYSILQQSSTAVLAQANLQPQISLQLLRKGLG